MNTYDSTTRVLLVCHAASTVGLGHLARLLALAQAMRKDGHFELHFLIFGDHIKRGELVSFNSNFLSLSEGFEGSVKKAVEVLNPRVVVFDLYPALISNALGELLACLKKRDIRLVGIDSLSDYCHVLDLVWVPSFYFDLSKMSGYTGKLKSGWDSFLIQKRLQDHEWKPGARVLVLTGGGDVTRLGRTLPGQLDALLENDTEIHWVRGPYSEPPTMPAVCRLRWHVHEAPTQLDELIVQSNYVLTVYGVSFFEVLQYGIPTVVFSPYGGKDDQELAALVDEKVAVVSGDSDTAVLSLVQLMGDADLAKSCSQKALEKLSVNGAQQLAEAVRLLAGV